MKTATEVSPEKLRGGFYTPEPLVNTCLMLVDKLCGEQTQLRILEPSVGDGAFLRSLVGHGLARRVSTFVGIEIIADEAHKCWHYAANASFIADIRVMSALTWATSTDEYFDVVVGNPPFVRYQFVSDSDILAIEQLGKRMGVSFRGVGNLWIPVLLGALSRLRPNGAMALVVPAEIFTGLAAGVARTWLLRNFADLRIDMFEAGSFPDVLQEVVVISGRKRNSSISDITFEGVSVDFVQHSDTHAVLKWRHVVPVTHQNWTRFLLTPQQLESLTAAQSLPGVQSFSNIAKLEVSIVTGANDFFSINTEYLSRFGLHRWAEPLLARIRYAEDLIYTEADHKATADTGAKAWLLNFSKEHPDPLSIDGPSEYLSHGEKLGLPLRYKTSIRSPWYRVPSIRPGRLLLSKRSHRYPRLVYNAANVLTTDTIYRGDMLPWYQGEELNLVGIFHNSLTLLTAELEGRSFGGGVLELVPSEIARLSVPFPLEVSGELPKLRQIARMSSASPEQQELLVEETNKIVCRKVVGLTTNLMESLQEARNTLVMRRLNRN